MPARFELEVRSFEGGHALAFTAREADGAPRPVLALPHALVVDVAPGDLLTVDGHRAQASYHAVLPSEDGMVAEAALVQDGLSFSLTDRWTRVADHGWRVDRSLEVTPDGEVGGPPPGFRLRLELQPAGESTSFDAFRYFAPPALYDLNDLNGDGIDDYLDARTLFFRDDKLNLRTVLAHREADGLGFALSRADHPAFDSVPDRGRGQTAFLQRTDIGSLGIETEREAGAPMTLAAAYPFVEPTRSHSLLVRERVPWGTFWPAPGRESITASYLVHLVEAPSAHEALWQVWTQRLADLDPRPVELPASHGEIAGLRLDALLPTLMEASEAPHPAGFVTNCHPQDGRQLGNVVQYGFTGQNVLNALNLLRSPRHGADPETRRKALRVIDFFVETAEGSPRGLGRGLYNFDTRRFGSWWTGLLLPLAYAEPDGDLEGLMGPVAGHLGPVIRALAGREGVYLRCCAEEFDALLMAYRHEAGHGTEHAAWLTACRRFAEFLLAVQRLDGAWLRAYSLDGEGLVEPDFWFGQTEVQRTSSTATVVPFLCALHAVTGEARLLDAARRAGAFAREHFVERMKFNGGIHDSIYAKPQLVDGESIMFSMRALLELHRATGEAGYLDGAVRAARLVVTWVCLWDVPLPPGSTLARHGFRSTGWMACDSPGAGYIHPMGILAVPDLIEIGRAAGEPALVRAAMLLQAGCNETVSVPGHDWGYARHGLQEEGLLVSWWFADDPMFADTGFGGRGKGEGNKTCLPWIAAVGVHAHQEMLARFGHE